MALTMFGATTLATFSTNQLAAASPLISAEHITNSTTATPSIWAYPDAIQSDHDFAVPGDQDPAVDGDGKTLTEGIGRMINNTRSTSHVTTTCTKTGKALGPKYKIHIAGIPKEEHSKWCGSFWDNLHGRSCSASSTKCGTVSNHGQDALAWSFQTTRFCPAQQVERAFYKATGGRFGELDCRSRSAKEDEVLVSTDRESELRLVEGDDQDSSNIFDVLDDDVEVKNMDTTITDEEVKGFAPIPSHDIELSPREKVGPGDIGAPHWVNSSQYCHAYNSLFTVEIRVRMAPHPEVTKENTDDLCQGLWDNLHHRSCTANKYFGYQDCGWEEEVGRLWWTITTSHFCHFDQVEAAFYEATYKGRYGPLKCETWKTLGINTWNDETQAFAIDSGEEITIDPTTSVIPMPTSEPTTLLTATPLPTTTAVPVADKLAATSFTVGSQTEAERKVAIVSDVVQSMKRDVGMNNSVGIAMMSNVTIESPIPANLSEYYDSPHPNLMNDTSAIKNARIGSIGSAAQGAIGSAIFDGLVDMVGDLINNATESEQRTQPDDPIN